MHVFEASHGLGLDYVDFPAGALLNLSKKDLFDVVASAMVVELGAAMPISPLAGDCLPR